MSVESVITFLSTGLTGSLLGVISIVLAVVLGLNSHLLSHFNRTRYISSIEARISEIEKSQKLYRNNLHVIYMTNIQFLALGNLIMAAISMIATLIITTSVEPSIQEHKDWLALLTTMFTVLSIYDCSRRVAKFTAARDALLAPRAVYAKLDTELNASARASILNGDDKARLNQLLAAHREKLENTLSPHKKGTKADVSFDSIFD